MTRRTKTPRQRAEEALGIAQRKRDRLHAQARQRRKELEDLDRELRDAEARLNYAKQDPALATPATSTTDTTGGTTP